MVLLHYFKSDSGWNQTCLESLYSEELEQINYSMRKAMGNGPGGEHLKYNDYSVKKHG